MLLKRLSFIPGTSCFISALVLLITVAANPCLRADELSEKGRDILEKYKKCVVTVEVVLKSSYSSGGRSSTPQEAKQDVTGTIVDSSGLVVLALSACDPMEMYQRMMGESSTYKVESEITDIKLLLDDNSEIPAEIVLRDKEQDLAFIRPKNKQTTPFASVDLSNSKAAKVLDQVITIGRLNRAANRAYAASIERISAIVQKPKTFYIPDSTMTATTLGMPAFTIDGQVVGVFVMRAVAGAGSRDYRHNVTTIILPASDVLKSAKQAPQVKEDDKNAESKSDAPAPKTGAKEESK